MEKGHINKVFGKNLTTYYLQARPVFQGLLWARLFQFILKKREGWVHCPIKSLYHSLNSHNHIYWYQSQLILLLNTIILGLENIWVTFNIKNRQPISFTKTFVTSLIVKLQSCSWYQKMANDIVNLLRYEPTLKDAYKGHYGWFCETW